MSFMLSQQRINELCIFGLQVATECHDFDRSKAIRYDQIKHLKHTLQ